MAEATTAGEPQKSPPPQLSFEERKKMWLENSDISEQEFDDLFARQKARQKDVPQPGSTAPDFEIDVLDRERKRTGETVKLSDLRGKPTGLIFGSYT
ncbi:MAG: hypothetical protein O3A84_03465 [Proteobacteria bacterium]|nr:hypothetical protein [Pseudomonadota bacterium]